MTPDRLVVPVQPDGNYPDIKAVKKHTVMAVARYRAYLPAGMAKARGRWENAAAESKQISGLVTPRVFCWLLAAQDVCVSAQVLRAVRLLFCAHPPAPPHGSWG
jgi:hypothetical protein